MELDCGPIGGFDADALALPAGEMPTLPIAPGHCSDRLRSGCASRRNE